MCSICEIGHQSERLVQLASREALLCPWCMRHLLNDIIIKCERCTRFRFLERTEDNYKLLSGLCEISIERFKEGLWICYLQACDKCKPKDPQVAEFVSRFIYMKYH